MTIRMISFALFPLAVAGCGGPSATVQYTNDTTTAQLTQISSTTIEGAGKTPALPPITPAIAGQTMRAGAATKPLQP